VEEIGNILNAHKEKYKVRPRYTVVLHDVREKLGLSLNTYVVVDSIHKLSTTNRNYPFCTMSKDEMAKFLKLSRATVFRSIQEGLKKGLIEKTPESFLRTTKKWIDLVEVYSIKK
jgi:hypothetical protein